MEDLNRHRWKYRFACPKYGHDNSWWPKHSHLHECAKCARQVLTTAGTVFEHTRLPLSKWFVATYLMGADEGGVRCNNFSKKSERLGRPHVQCRGICAGQRGTATAITGSEGVEADYVFVKGRKPDKRGRGPSAKGRCS